ncbi:MAG TPA: hypothetical protein VEW45_02605, partial [Candidatus Dormibacteraeota bacterium]|nr:hypothetical protein [Candidatus Dormibacteraeota bacterium]
MNRRSLPILLAASIVALAACQAATSPSMSAGVPSEATAPSGSSAPSDTPSASPLPTADPVPPDELGPFSCEF